MLASALRARLAPSSSLHLFACVRNAACFHCGVAFAARMCGYIHFISFLSSLGDGMFVNSLSVLVRQVWMITVPALGSGGLVMECV